MTLVFSWGDSKEAKLRSKQTYRDRQVFRAASKSLLPIRRPNGRPWR